MKLWRLSCHYFLGQSGKKQISTSWVHDSIDLKWRLRVLLWQSQKRYFPRHLIQTVVRCYPLPVIQRLRNVCVWKSSRFPARSRFYCRCLPQFESGFQVSPLCTTSYCAQEIHYYSIVCRRTSELEFLFTLAFHPSPSRGSLFIRICHFIISLDFCNWDNYANLFTLIEEQWDWCFLGQ